MKISWLKLLDCRLLDEMGLSNCCGVTLASGEQGWATRLTCVRTKLKEQGDTEDFISQDGVSAQQFNEIVGMMGEKQFSDDELKEVVKKLTFGTQSKTTATIKYEELQFWLASED